MTLVYMEDGEHKTLDVVAIEVSIDADVLEVKYDAGTSLKWMCIEKNKITSINVKY